MKPPHPLILLEKVKNHWNGVHFFSMQEKIAEHAPLGV